MKRVFIAFICDSHYIMPTAVAITSLICNKNQDTYYDIFIIADGLSEKETEKFHECKRSGTDIHIIKAPLKRFGDIKKCVHVNSTACLKFDLADLISSQDKVLYLDGDVIIQKDLSDLFETNINDYYAAAVKDIPLIHNDLHIDNYFNSGVMLLNLNLMRKHNVSEALFNIRKSRNDLTYMDQDCFNILFNNKVRLLPVIYNFEYNIFFHEKRKFPLEDINKCFGTNYQSLTDIEKDSYIIHFAAHYKPWIYYDTVLAREWYEYYRKSPFKLHKLKRKSASLIKFIFSNNMLTVLFYFFQYWHDHGFKFAMRKVKYFFSKKNYNKEMAL